MRSVRVIRTMGELSEYEPVWNDLVRRSQFDDVFLTWEWMSNWSRVFLANGDGNLMAIAVHEGGEVVAIAPLWVETIRYGNVLELRVLKAIGAGASDYFDFVVRADGVRARTKAIWDHLLGPLRDEWDVFELFDVPDGSPVLAVLRLLAERDTRSSGAKFVQNTICPYAPLPSTWDSLLRSFPRRTRYAVSYSRRRLNGQGDLRVRFCERSDELSGMVNDLIRLNRKSWNERGKAGAFATEELERFHHMVSRELFDRGRLFLCSLELDARHIGSFYGFDYADKVYYYSSAIERNPVSRVKVGTVLLGVCIEESIQRGRREFDLLRGNERYKRLWTRQYRSTTSFRIYNKHIRSGVIFLYRQSRRLLRRYRVPA